MDLQLPSEWEYFHQCITFSKPPDSSRYMKLLVWFWFWFQLVTVVIECLCLFLFYILLWFNSSQLLSTTQQLAHCLPCLWWDREENWKKVEPMVWNKNSLIIERKWNESCLAPAVLQKHRMQMVGLIFLYLTISTGTCLTRQHLPLTSNNKEKERKE